LKGRYFNTTLRLKRKIVFKIHTFHARVKFIYLKDLTLNHY